MNSTERFTLNIMRVTMAAIALMGLCALWFVSSSKVTADVPAIHHQCEVTQADLKALMEVIARRDAAQDIIIMGLVSRMDKKEGVGR